MRSHLLLLTLASATAACGRDTPVDPLRNIVPVPGGITASAVIGVSGGVLELGSADGARFRLDVPAGALDSTTTITIATSDATREQRFHLRFAPEGLAFHSPATVTVELPAAHALSPGGALTYNAVPMPMVRLDDGRMRIPIRRFATPLPIPVTSFLSASFSASLGLQPREAPRTSEGLPPCESTVGSEQFVAGGLVAVDEIEGNLYRDCASVNVFDVWRTGTYSSAVRLADATDAAFQRPIEPASPVWLDGLRTSSCALLLNVVARGAEPAAERFGLLHWRIGRVLFLVQYVERVGGSCTGLTTYPAALEAAVGAEATYAASRTGMITSVTHADYAAALKDAREGVLVSRELAMLGASAAVVGHAERVVRDIAHPALVGVLLPAAQAACTQSGNTAPLAQLIGIMGPRPELTAALGACPDAAVRQP